MFLTDDLIQIIASFFGTLGFGVLFNIRGKKLVYAAFGGLFAWALFLGLECIVYNEVVRYFIVSIFSTMYAEILARILKTPATTFSIITLVPLIPGGALYQTATSAMNGNTEQFVSKFIYTAELAIALSLGIVIVTSLFKYVKRFKKA